MRGKIYTDYLTNLAVAWFAGGVIAPILSLSFSLKSLFTGIFAIVASLAFLQMSVRINKRKRR